MVRYFVIATVLVVGTFVAVTAYHTYALRIRVAGGRATMPPKATGSEAKSAAALLPLRGDAPWALSALPECLIQVQEWKGTLRYALSHVPRDATVIASPAQLHYADCRVSIVGDEAFVRRGGDRLRIPPRARFYRVAGEIALLWMPRCARRVCGATLRIYRAPKTVR